MRAAVWLSIAGALCALGVSCSFPDVTFAPDDAAGESAAGDSAEAGDGGDPCDKDHDGYRATSCGGNDCNDDDPRVNPGESFRSDVPDTGPLLGDWNCDGRVEPLYPTIACGATSCSAQGFETVVGCGVIGQLVVCTGLLCPAVDAGMQTQECR